VLLIGVICILFGGLFFYIETKGEKKPFKVVSFFLDFDFSNPGPGLIFLLGILLVLGVIVAFFIKLFK
jgi:hypothetical protein